MAEIDVLLPDRADIELDYDTVANCDDVGLLHKWFADLQNEILEAQCFAKGFLDAGVADEAQQRAMGGRIGYIRVGISWVERRLLAMGERPNYPPNDPRSRELMRLNEALGKAKRKLAELGEELPS